MTVLHASGNTLRPVGTRFALATTLMVLIGLCHLVPMPMQPDQAGTAVPAAAPGGLAPASRNHGAPAPEANRPNGTGSAARKAGDGGGRGLSLPGVLRGR